MATVRQVMQPAEWNPELQVMQVSDYLRVVVDLYDDHSHQEIICLRFADYQGLQAEWEGGVATVVLGAAVATALGGAEGDGLTPGQRGAVGVVIGQE